MLLRELGRRGNIVIRRSTIKYQEPVTSSEIYARCRPVTPAETQYFLEMLDDKGQTKLDLAVEVAGSRGAGRFVQRLVRGAAERRDASVLANAANLAFASACDCCGRDVPILRLPIWHPHSVDGSTGVVVSSICANCVTSNAAVDAASANRWHAACFYLFGVAGRLRQSPSRAESDEFASVRIAWINSVSASFAKHVAFGTERRKSS